MDQASAVFCIYYAVLAAMTDLMSPLSWSTGLPTSPAVQHAPRPQLNVCEEIQGAAELCIFRVKAPWEGVVLLSAHLASHFPLKAR